MITQISWKNVWRNKTRSLVVIVAVTLGTVAGVFVAGLMNGWVAQRINDVIYIETGHLKIQNPKFLINEEIDYSIENVVAIKNYLDQCDKIKAYSMRTKIPAVATTARGTAGIMLKGIDLENEKQTSEIYKKLMPNAGNYFDSHTRLPQIVISNKTAELLKIKNYRITEKVMDSLQKQEVPREILQKLDPIKDKRFITKKKFETAIKGLWSKTEIRKYAPAVTTTAAYFQPRAKIAFSFSSANGEIAYQTYQVCGIFKTANTMFDQMSAFVLQKDLIPVSGLANHQIHEISILLNSDNTDDIKALQQDMIEKFPEQSILTWKQLAPDAGMMSDFMQLYYYIIMGVIFFALAFGIINTMLMAILDRIKELGMLMAIGMKKLQVFTMIMLETIFLTLTGSVVGMLIGALLLHITGKTGLNFATVAEGFEAVGWSAQVYPSIETSFFFGVTLLVIVVAILSSIIPARKALKLKPVEAIRIE